ncbi:hypothetical protein DID73_00595 [Candidatus Marinamargulisbacteria bacterium SCGC AG-343-K17]|nr:hypothetical protein DID73_00595 [Candidatus Marinamargulisbacteria bacterium SCGC AG-343-K17]
MGVNALTKFFSAGLLAFGSKPVLNQEQTARLNRVPAVDDGSDVSLSPYDQVDSRALTASVSNVLGYDQVDSRALSALESRDLMYEPGVYSGNLDQAAQCGSKFVRVNQHGLSSIVETIAKDNPNIKPSNNFQLHPNLPPVSSALNITDNIRASIQELDPTFNVDATIHYNVADNDGQLTIQDQFFWIDYKDNNTFGVIFMTKDGGVTGFPQMFQFNMSPIGMNELGHTVFFEHQQDDAVRVSFPDLFFTEDTDRSSQSAIKLQNATTVLTDPNPSNTFTCLPLTQMAADDDLDDVVSVRTLQFEDDHNGDSYMLFPNQDGSYGCVKRNNATGTLSHHPVIVDNTVSYLDANAQLDVDLGFPDDIANCASESFDFTKITSNDQKTLVDLFENTTSNGLTHFQSHDDDIQLYDVPTTAKNNLQPLTDTLFENKTVISHFVFYNSSWQVSLQRDNRLFGIVFSEINDGKEGDKHFIQPVGITGVFSCTTLKPNMIPKSAIILHTHSDGLQPMLYESQKGEFPFVIHQNDFGSKIEEEVNVFFPSWPSAIDVEVSNVLSFPCENHLWIQALRIEEGQGVLVPDGQQLIMVREVDGHIVKTPLILQQAHGLKHLFPDTSAVKGDTYDKDDLPIIADNSQIDFEARVHSGNRDDFAACATTVSAFDVNDFNYHMANIQNIQYNNPLHRNETEVMFRFQGDRTFLATPALTHVPDAEKKYVHDLLGLDFVDPDATLHFGVFDDNLHHFGVFDDNLHVDKSTLILKHPNGQLRVFLAEPHTGLSQQDVPSAYELTVGADGQLIKINGHHVFYTDESEQPLPLEFPTAIQKDNNDWVVFEFAKANMRLDGDGGADEEAGHPCLKSKFFNGDIPMIFQVNFPEQNRLLVLGTDGNYSAIESNSDGTFTKHPVTVDNSGVPPILKDQNKNMTVSEARYFSDDIIKAGRCAERKVAFHEIPRLPMPGDENGQYLPTSSEGLTEYHRHIDPITEVEGPIFYELKSNAKDIMDTLGRAIYGDDEYLNFKPVIFFKNTTSVGLGNEQRISEVGWIQTTTDNEKKIHLYSNQALPMVHSFQEGDGIQLRYLVTATRTQPEFVIVGEGGLPSFRMKDPLSAINASQVISPTLALIGPDSGNLAQWNDHFEKFPLAFHCNGTKYRNYGYSHHDEDKNIGLLVPVGGKVFRVFLSPDGYVVQSEVTLLNAEDKMQSILTAIQGDNHDDDHDSSQDSNHGDDHNSDHHHVGALSPSPVGSPSPVAPSVSPSLLPVPAPSSGQPVVPSPLKDDGDFSPSSVGSPSPVAPSVSPSLLPVPAPSSGQPVVPSPLKDDGDFSPSSVGSPSPVAPSVSPSLLPVPAPSSGQPVVPSPGTFPVNKGTTTAKPELPDGSPSPTQGSLVKIHNASGSKNNVVIPDTEESHISAGEWAGIIGGGSFILISISCFLKNRYESSGRPRRWLYFNMAFNKPKGKSALVHPAANVERVLELVEKSSKDGESKVLDAEQVDFDVL